MANLIDHNSPFLADLDYANLSVADQAQVDALIDVASVMIEKRCNRIFLADDYEEDHDGTDENSIFVKNIPINSLTSITITFPDQTIVYDAAVFDYKPLIGEIWFKPRSQVSAALDYLGTFPGPAHNPHLASITSSRFNINISYNGGFSEVPSPIKLLCANTVIQFFSPDNAANAIEAEKLGQYFYKLRKDAVTDFIIANKDILNLYKIRKV